MILHFLSVERIEVARTLCYVDGMVFLPHDGDGVVGGGVPITGLHGDAPSAHFVHLADGDRVANVDHSVALSAQRILMPPSLD